MFENSTAEFDSKAILNSTFTHMNKVVCSPIYLQFAIDRLHLSTIVIVIITNPNINNDNDNNRNKYKYKHIFVITTTKSIH